MQRYHGKQLFIYATQVQPRLSYCILFYALSRRLASYTNEIKSS